MKWGFPGPVSPNTIQCSEDILVPKRSPNVSKGKPDRANDESRISNKPTTEKGAKSSHAPGTNTLHKFEIKKSPNVSRVALESTKLTKKLSDLTKQKRLAEGIINSNFTVSMSLPTYSLKGSS